MADRELEFLESGHVRCNVCMVELTSAKMYDEHCKGKNHLKKKSCLGGASVLASAIIGGASVLASASNSGIRVYPTHHQSTATPPSVGDLPMSSWQTDILRKIHPEECTINALGVGRCMICDIDLSSWANTKQHIDGKQHTKKKYERQLIAQMSGLKVDTTTRSTSDGMLSGGAFACAPPQPVAASHNFAGVSPVAPMVPTCPWFCGFCKKSMNTTAQLRIHLWNTFSHQVLSEEQKERLLIEGAPNYGQGSAPNYGQGSAPNYGQGSAPTYGQGSAPNCAQGSAPNCAQGFGHKSSDFTPNQTDDADDDFFTSLREDSSVSTARCDAEAAGRLQPSTTFTCDICQVKVATPEDMTRHNHSHEERDGTTMTVMQAYSGATVPRAVNVPKFHGIAPPTVGTRNLENAESIVCQASGSEQREKKNTNLELI